MKVGFQAGFENLLCTHLTFENVASSVLGLSSCQLLVNEYSLKSQCIIVSYLFWLFNRRCKTRLPKVGHDDLPHNFTYQLCSCR